MMVGDTKRSLLPPHANIQMWKKRLFETPHEQYYNVLYSYVLNDILFNINRRCERQTGQWWRDDVDNEMQLCRVCDFACFSPAYTHTQHTHVSMEINMHTKLYFESVIYRMIRFGEINTIFRRDSSSQFENNLSVRTYRIHGILMAMNKFVHGECMRALDK